MWMYRSAAGRSCSPRRARCPPACPSGQLRSRHVQGRERSSSCGYHLRRMCSSCTAASRYRGPIWVEYKPHHCAGVMDVRELVRLEGRFRGKQKLTCGRISSCGMPCWHPLLCRFLLHRASSGHTSRLQSRNRVNEGSPQPTRPQVLHLHAGHVPQTEPGMWAKSPMTSPWFTGCLLSIRTLGRPPREPSESYELVLSTLSLTVLVVVLTAA